MAQISKVKSYHSWEFNVRILIHIQTKISFNFRKTIDPGKKRQDMNREESSIDLE
jgi:hypothetical protein